MSANEIKSFEDFWKLLMNFFQAIIDFMKSAFGGKIDVGSTNTVYYDSITFVG